MDDVRDAINSAIQTFTDAFGRGDAAAIAAWYTEDATLMPPGAPMMKGHGDIRNYWQTAMNSGVKEAKLETLSVESRDVLAYEVGRFEMTAVPGSGPATKLTGKYVVVWKLENNAWKMHVDIWNGDQAG